MAVKQLSGTFCGLPSMSSLLLVGNWAMENGGSETWLQQRLPTHRPRWYQVRPCLFIPSIKIVSPKNIRRMRTVGKLSLWK
jgi:hypothetical protein